MSRSRVVGLNNWRVSLCDTVSSIAHSGAPREGRLPHTGSRFDVNQGNGPVETQDLCCVCFAFEPTVRLVGNECRHGLCDDCAVRSLEAVLENDQWPARW